MGAKLDAAVSTALKRLTERQPDGPGGAARLLSSVGGISLQDIVTQTAGRTGTEPRQAFLELCELMLLIGAESLPLYLKLESGDWLRAASGGGEVAKMIFSNTLRGAWLDDAPRIGVRTGDAILQLGYFPRPLFRAQSEAVPGSVRRRQRYTEDERRTLLAEFDRLREECDSDNAAAELLVLTWPTLAPGHGEVTRQNIVKLIHKWRKPVFPWPVQSTR